MSESTPIKGYKAFNEKLQCTPEGKVFQYAVGQTYHHEGPAKLCEAGFHFCLNPLDLFAYYLPTGRFAEVEATEVDSREESDSKRAARSLKICAEISLSHLLGLGVKFILDRVDGKKIKAETFYQLKGGKFVEVE